MNHETLAFHTIHGSFVGGRGIRSTVFLKGCPLKCTWCCNPEGQSFQPELKVNRGQYNGCSSCLSICFRNALSLVDGLVQIDYGICDGYIECVEHYYTSALESFGVRYTTHEIFEVVRNNEMFYKNTGGGITAGGGECTYYPDFMLESTQLCHNSGIHVAIDARGCTASFKALEILKAADLLLFDIRGIDPMRRKKNTRKSNEIILQNLHSLSEIRKPTIIHVPVIPGYNDSNRKLNGIADLLSTLKSVKRVDILPEHKFGRVKYEQLDLEYRLKPCPISAR